MRQLLYRMRSKVVIRLHHDFRNKIVEIQCLCLVPDDDIDLFRGHYFDSDFEVIWTSLKFRWPFSIRCLDDSDLKISFFNKWELPMITDQWADISTSFYLPDQFVYVTTSINPKNNEKFGGRSSDKPYHPDTVHMLTYFLGQLHVEYEREGKQPRHHALGLIEKRLTGFINQERQLIHLNTGLLQPIN